MHMDRTEFMYGPMCAMVQDRQVLRANAYDPSNSEKPEA